MYLTIIHPVSTEIQLNEYMTVFHYCHTHTPVVIGQLDVVARHQDLAILQPDKVWLRNTLGHTGEHSTAPCWFGHRLRPL